MEITGTGGTQPHVNPVDAYGSVEPSGQAGTIAGSRDFQSTVQEQDRITFERDLEKALEEKGAEEAAEQLLDFYEFEQAAAEAYQERVRELLERALEESEEDESRRTALLAQWKKLSDRINSWPTLPGHYPSQ